MAGGEQRNRTPKHFWMATDFKSVCPHGRYSPIMAAYTGIEPATDASTVHCPTGGPISQFCGAEEEIRTLKNQCFEH